MMLLFAALLLLFLPGIASAQGITADSESVTITVNHDDGGKRGKRHMILENAVAIYYNVQKHCT